MTSQGEQHGIPRGERFAKLPEVARASFSKKDTKRWCRGVRGVEHQPVAWQYWFGGCAGSECGDDPERNVICRHRQYMIKRCLACGRKMDFCTLDSRKPPTPQLIELRKLAS